MDEYIVSTISFYKQLYVDGTTYGPTNEDYHTFYPEGDDIELANGGGYFEIEYTPVTAGCLINSTPGTRCRLYNLTDNVQVGNEVDMYSALGDGNSISTSTLGITTLTAGKKYVLQIKQLCSGDSNSHARVLWHMFIKKQSSGTKVLHVIPMGGNFTVNGTTAAEGSTIKLRWDGFDSNIMKNGDGTPATLRVVATGKAAATRTNTTDLWSVADGGRIARLTWTETDYTTKADDVTAPTDGSELQVRMNSSVAATLAYQQGMDLYVYTVQPAAVKHVLVGQNAGLSAVISSTSYAAQDPRFLFNVLDADYETLSDWRWGSVLLAGASGITYAQLYDGTSAIASTELSHNTTTATLKTMTISDPLDLTNYFRVYNKRATSNGRSFGWWVEFKETLTYPASTRRIFIT